MISIKFIILAIIFVITSGALFSNYFKKNKMLSFLAVLISIIGSAYLMEKIYNDISDSVYKKINKQNITKIVTDENTEKLNIKKNKDKKEKLLEEKISPKEKKHEKRRLDQKKIEREESKKREVLAREEYTKIENSIASHLNIPVSSVKPLLRTITVTIRGIQDSIIKITDSKTDYSLRKNIIKSTIKEYFLSPEVIVQSSSLNHYNTTSRTVKNYFQHLLNLSNTENIKINISFSDELRIISMWFNSSKKEKTIEVSVDQMFEICEGSRCENNMTKKVIQIKLKKDNIAVVAKIYVTDTYSVEKK